MLLAVLGEEKKVAHVKVKALLLKQTLKLVYIVKEENLEENVAAAPPAFSHSDGRETERPEGVFKQPCGSLMSLSVHLEAETLPGCGASLTYLWLVIALNLRGMVDKNSSTKRREAVWKGVGGQNSLRTNSHFCWSFEF